MKPVRWGLVGLGGYAGAICDELLRAASSPETCRFLAAAEPNQSQHAARIADLRERGIKVLESIDQLLNEPIDAVWLPVPIHLHRPFTEKAAAAGKAVICEKPAAGCIDDLHAMIAARDRHGVKAAIAFQDLYKDQNLAVKRAIIDGEIGQVQAVTVHACWPRGKSYYGRNAWAGALKREGVWVMDSPANNALAHDVNLPLFFLGERFETMGQPTAIAAELYRVNPIENYDTCSLRITVNGRIPLLIHFTHATETNVHPVIRINGSAGRIEWEMYKPAHVHSRSGPRQIPEGPDGRTQALEKFNRWLRGDDSVLVESFEMAAEQLKVVNAASEASAVRTIDERFVRVLTQPSGDELRIIPGIESLFAHCSERGQMLHETRQVEWSSPAGEKSLTGYDHFAGPRVGG